MRSRLSRILSGLVVTAGVGAVLVGLSVFVEAWQASRAWAGTGHDQRARVPAEAPLWLDGPVLASAAESEGAAVPAPSQPDGVGGMSVIDAEPASVAAAPRATPEARASDRAPPPEGTNPPGQGQRIAAAPAGTPASTSLLPEPVPARPVPALAAPADVEVAEIDFRFLDPPEPGAHARLAVTIVNRAGLPTDALGVVLPIPWLQEFSVMGAVPDVLDDRPDGDVARRFVFPGLRPGEQQTVELHVLATGEEVEAPEVRVLLADDAEIGRGRPRTVAPRPRPGPARAVAIPKLSVQAAVVPVPWEPPSFVVGQVEGTAAVSEGNTVLIGHLTGPLGDVFARLDRLRPGDEVVATSRGLAYRFIVSEIAVRPFDDVTQTEPTATPRLTLMTCTGQWSILRQDYSHRLWVVAEPPELAQQTIRANAERAEQAAREAEAAAAERMAHEAEVEANATATAETQAQEAVAPSQARPEGAVAPTQAPGEGQPQAVTAPTRPSGTDQDESSRGAPPALPLPSPEASPAAPEDAMVPGIVIETPTDGDAVSPRLTVRGRQTPDAVPGLTYWLVVRAAVEGSRWYALDAPLTADERGRWAAELELGGRAGVRHEVRVLAVDAAGDAALRRHAAERRGQPLDGLPPASRTGARVTVERR